MFQKKLSFFTRIHTIYLDDTHTQYDFPYKSKKEGKPKQTFLLHVKATIFSQPTNVNYLKRRHNHMPNHDGVLKILLLDSS